MHKQGEAEARKAKQASKVALLERMRPIESLRPEDLSKAERKDLRSILDLGWARENQTGTFSLTPAGIRKALAEFAK